jgi:hypothetical protein
MFFINPFIYAGGGDFESIATVTVGSGGASSIEFTSIPSTYQHLQIRGICKDARSSTNAPFSIRLNSDSGSNYAQHELQGGGSSANAYSATSVSSMQYIGYTAANQANIFGGAIVDILDYANTSKNTVARAFSGVDNNGSGVVAISSGLWLNTAAVTTVTLLPFTSPFGQHSTFALYGVKAP